MAYVGGDTAVVGDVAEALAGCGRTVASTAPVLASSGGTAAAAAGEEVVGAALERSGLAWVAVADGVGAQVSRLGRVAATAAGDLARAGGN